MGSQQQHCREDIARFGRAYPEVHQLLDQFAHFPDMRFLSRHRKFLHHEEGIEYVRMRWGEEAGKAALQHVITDCGHVPAMVDYHNGAVDNYGVKL
jgi:hypothetical protein